MSHLLKVQRSVFHCCSLVPSNLLIASVLDGWRYIGSVVTIMPADQDILGSNLVAALFDMCYLHMTPLMEYDQKDNKIRQLDSWQISRFRHQWSTVWIQSSVLFFMPRTGFQDHQRPPKVELDTIKPPNLVNFLAKIFMVNNLLICARGIGENTPLVIL